MFYIVGGKTEFTQWETDQKLMNEHMQSGDTVVFASASGKTHNMTAYDLAGQAVVDVPNDMLQAAQGIVVTLGQGAEHRGGCRTAFAVVAADMPDGYSYRDNSKAKPNATHYDTRDIRTVTYTFDGNLEGKEVVEANGGTFVKVSDEFPELSSIMRIDIRGKQGMPESLEDFGWAFASETHEAFFWDMGDNVLFIMDGAALYSSSDAEATDEHSAIPKGFYLGASINDEEVWYVSKLDVTYCASGELKKLDEKFLPLPMLIVTVSDGEVDENGITQLVASHTAREIIDTFNAGKPVFLNYSEYCLPLYSYFDDGYNEPYVEFDCFRIRGTNKIVFRKYEIGNGNCFMESTTTVTVPQS